MGEAVRAKGLQAEEQAQKDLESYVNELKQSVQAKEQAAVEMILSQLV